MVNLDLTLMHSNTLVVSVRPSNGDTSRSREVSSDAAIPTAEAAESKSPASSLMALDRAIRVDAVENLLVVLASDFSLDTLHEVASWFPRRLNGGRVAVASLSHVKGRAFASTLTVPLLPRPVRVFPLHDVERALSWVSRGEAPLDVAMDFNWSPPASTIPPLNLSFLSSFVTPADLRQTTWK